MKGNKTTVAGIIAIVMLVLSIVSSFVDGDPNTNVDWAQSGSALAAAVAALFARDWNSSDRDEGVA